MRHWLRISLLLSSVSIFLLSCSDDNAQKPDGGVNPGDDGAVQDGAPGDGGGSTTKGPKTVTCNNKLTAPATGTCSVSKGSGSAVLYSGTVLTPDKVYLAGQVLVDSGKIVYVGCDASGSSGASSATKIECAKGVISPGLINAHDHLGWTRYEPMPTTERYDHRHEWRTGKNGKTKVKYAGSSYNSVSLAWGELRMVLGGATSIMAASSGATKLARNLDGKTEGLSTSAVTDTTFPLGDTSGTLITSGCGYKSKPDPAKCKSYSAWVPHVSEGGIAAARNEFKCLSGQGSGAVKVTLQNAAFIHSVGLTARDIMLMASGGTMAIWSPRSNISLYGYTAQVAAMHNMGVGIAMGTDWTISGSMNMLRELRCAADYNKHNLSGFFSAYQLWLMATANGAEALGAAKELGAIKTGMVADLAIFDGAGLGATQQPHAAVVGADVSKVVLVLRGGTVLHGDTALVKALDSQGGSGCEALTDCLKDKSICVKREVGKTLSELKTAALAAKPVQTKLYPLYFCKTPDKEPTCVPSRPSEYTGKPSATDSDGDGIVDSKDSCPKVFNPVLKMDGSAQPNADGDALGDACDVCPLDVVNKTPCKSSPDPNDSDGDGVVNAKDNCPSVANKDQKDTDKDKIGDACDACPTKANPLGAPCPFSVKDLRDVAGGKQPPQKTTVQIKDVVVTAIPGASSTTKGFYVREGTGAHQAIYIYTASKTQQATDKTALKPGHVVSIKGTFETYNKIDEISKPTAITINTSKSNTATPPAAVAIKTADLQPGSKTAEGWESHYVKVSKVTVAVGPSTSDAFWVTDTSGETCSGSKPACTKIGDFFYDGSKKNGKPAGKAAQTFSSISGIVNGYKDGHDLDPGSDADLVTP